VKGCDASRDRAVSLTLVVPGLKRRAVRLPPTGTALALAALLACGTPDSASAPPGPERTVPVETVVAATDDVEVVVEAVGTLRAERAVDLGPKRAGHVTALPLVEGAPAAAGDVLVTLDDTELRAEVDVQRAAVREAEAKATNARRQLERTETLLADGIVARQQYDDLRAEADRAQAALALARASLASAEARLDETVIRAPFAGVVGQRRVDLGAFVHEGDPLVSLVDLDPLELVFEVPERYLTQLHREAPVAVRVASHRDRAFRGAVTFVAPQVDETNRTVTVKAALPNADGALRPGQFASARLVLERREGAVVVPEEVVVSRGEQRFVFVVRDGKASAQEITTGERLAGRVEVPTGLAAGETIVRLGQDQLSFEQPTPVAPPAPPGDA
jgi:membrane fusion protein (multidrug efflux system)